MAAPRAGRVEMWHMFFYPSKIFWLLAAPANAFTFLALAGTLLAFTRFTKAGRWLALLGAAGLLACGMGPVGHWLMRPLEDRFARPAPPDRIAGIIVLGGAIGSSRGETSLNDSAARMTDSVALALRYPEARLAFTGGDASLIGRPDGVVWQTEAAAARRFYLSMGIPESRLILEDRSRNTRENAVLLKPMLDQKPGERWLLVTSAWHMPRSVGVFRRAGIEVIPWPVDYVTSGTPADHRRISRSVSHGLGITDLAAKEWVGLVAYRLAGYTDALLPAP